MFTTKDHIERKSAASGRGRFEYLQALVTEFQDTDSHDSKLQILANLANFAYDPINYEHLRKLNVVDLFLDMLSEEDENMVKFGIAGICNLCTDRENRQYINDNDGVESVIRCLSSSNEETVINTIASLMFLVDSSNKAEITSDAVLDCMKKFAGSPNVRLKNLAMVFLQDYGGVRETSAL